MSTVRRLYFYGLALISVEVIVWGVINLLRTIFSSGFIGGSLLASGLSLVLVGIPIFLLHWRVAQRDAARDIEERSSRIRPVFLYAALASTLLPGVYAILALINRAAVSLLGALASQAWFGGDGTPVDNLIALLINAVAFAYFWSVLRKDWKADIPENFLADTRRLYRYMWVLIGLTMTVSGVFNLLRFLFSSPGDSVTDNSLLLAGAVSLLIVGAPLWSYSWWSVQAALVEPEERGSLLRLVVLYLISLVGVIGVLSTAGSALKSLIDWITGDANTLWTFFQGNSAELGALIPLAVMWWYYSRILNREVAAVPDQPRREALRRLYHYILSALGLAVTFFGALNLVNFLTQMIFSDQNLIGSLRSSLSESIAALLVGLPLWLVNWRRMQDESASLDDTGDHSRRSVLRKAYLYLALFLFVLGAMIFTGQMLYTLLNALLSQPEQGLALEVSRMFLALVIDVALLVYHWRALRSDGLTEQRSLDRLHAAFPTLVILDEAATPAGIFEQNFAQALTQILARTAPRLPMAVHSIERGAPDDALLNAKVILLPASLVMEPPESLRLWLDEFHGKRMLIPFTQAGWIWLGQTEKRPQELAREAAQSLRQMAEGESLRAPLPNNPWTVAGFILGGIFGLLLLFAAFSLLFSSFFR